MLRASCHVVIELTLATLELKDDDWNKNKSIFIKTLEICASIIATISLVNWMFSSARMVSMLMCGLLLKFRSSSEDWYSRQASSLAPSSDIFEPLGRRLSPHNLNYYTNITCNTVLLNICISSWFPLCVECSAVCPRVLRQNNDIFCWDEALQNVRRTLAETARHLKRFIVERASLLLDWLRWNADVWLGDEDLALNAIGQNRTIIFKRSLLEFNNSTKITTESTMSSSPW